MVTLDGQRYSLEPQKPAHQYVQARYSSKQTGAIPGEEGDCLIHTLSPTYRTRSPDLESLPCSTSIPRNCLSGWQCLNLSLTSDAQTDLWKDAEPG